METTTTYVPPEVLAIMNENVIHSRMLSNLPEGLDKTPGGFAYDFTRPAALEKAEMMVRMNEAIQIFFPEWSYGGYLDMIGARTGIVRRPATCATGEVTVTGVTGTVIPKGFLFVTPSTQISSSMEFAATEEKTIPGSGTVTVPIKCVDAGIAGNVAAGSITLMASPMLGITGVTNVAPTTGGTPPETDDSLRERIKDLDMRTAYSFVGCDSDYKRWAQEVPGVGDVTVIPEWSGAGTGTVKLIVMDSTGQPASQTIIDAVYNHIVSPDDRNARLAPIGAIVTVETAELVNISINATVTLTERTLQEVTDDFAAALNTYFAQAKAEGVVRYTRVASVLSAIKGVSDFASLTVNGGTSNVTIDVDEYPAVDEIDLSEA